MIDGTTIDRKHAVPLYHQIFLQLRDEIIGGVRAFGTAVPTEQELAAQYQVSRITARRALYELAQEGFVERRRRTGTRVVHRVPTRPIEANMDQALESLLAFGRNTRVRVIDIATEVASVDVAERLRIAPGDAVVRAVRLRLLENELLGEVISYVPAALGLSLAASDLVDTPMLALLQEAGHTIGGGEQTISATVAGSRLATLLEIDARAPVLRVERSVVDTSGRALLLTIARYRADRYRIAIDLHAPTAGAPSLA
jgi:GntR family transcriptional regulator